MADDDILKTDPDLVRRLQAATSNQSGTLTVDPSLVSTGTTQSPPVALENLSRFLPGGQQGIQQGIQQGTQYQSLAQTRSPFVQELQNPEARRLLMASTEAEVGGQGSTAQQAYMESVMNRASARNSSLADTLLDPHYYPDTTKNKLGAQMSDDQINRYNPLIDQVLGGSNISNLGTGNESGPKRIGKPPPPIVYAAGGERFVAENDTIDWRQKQLAAMSQRVAQTNTARQQQADYTRLW